MPSIARRIPHFFRLLGIAAGLLACTVDARGDDRVIVSFPIVTPEPIHRIVSIDAVRRQARIELVPEALPASMPTEGQAVLVVPSKAGGPLTSLARVEIDELLEGNVALATFGKGAEGAIRPGPAILIRPFAGLVGDAPPVPAPTKAISKLPDLLVAGAGSPTSATDPRALSRGRDTQRRSESIDHLKRIALAFHNFADAYGTLPPPAVIGPDGKPWHSWRVLLLPFLEEAGLYQQYDFSQPWDSVKNRPLADRTVKIYRDPAREGPADGISDYAAIVGRAAVFQPGIVKMESERDFPACLTKGKKVTLASVTDGTSNTIIFATVDPSRNIPWTKPEDILLDDGFAGLGKARGIGAIHPATDDTGKLGLVAFADGAVSALPTSTDQGDLMKLLTARGGEVVDRSNLAAATGPTMVKVVSAEDGSLQLEID